MHVYTHMCECVCVICVCKHTAVLVRVFVRVVLAVVDLVAYLPLPNAAAVAAHELIRGAGWGLCTTKGHTAKLVTITSSLKAPPHRIAPITKCQ